MNAAKKIAVEAEAEVAPGQKTSAFQIIGENIWVAEQPFEIFPFGEVGARMTVVRLENQELFIHSPIQLTEDIRRDLLRLGTPRYLIGPNDQHFLYLQDYVDAFPAIKLFGTAGLLKKANELNFYGTLTQEKLVYPWSKQLSQIVIYGRREFAEAVFFHESSNTVLMTDLVMNFTSLGNWHQRLARRLLAIGDERFTVSRKIRACLKDQATRFKLIAWLEPLPIRRLVVSHGRILEVTAQDLTKYFVQ